MNLYDLITQDLYGMEDPGIAYRKAKVDLYYSSRCCRKELSNYEAKLFENLEALQSLLQKGEAPTIPKEAWTLVPKSIKPNEIESELISSEPEYLWSEVCRDAESGKTKSKQPEAEFRIMEALPVEFHVFAALWIQKVGHKFEAMLTNAACGNRLRRKKPKKDQGIGKLNPLSLGSTVPYLYPYCKWRDDGIRAMHDALDADKKVVAITADVSSFYHELDVSFMLDPEFIDRIDVKLTKDEKVLHNLFVGSLQDWAAETPLKKGLPVGLSASGVIANVALFELDKMMKEEVTPLYYGRYVDDIILVMENGADFKSSAQVWEWLKARSDGALILKGTAAKRKIRYKQPYLKGSTIIFENEKNKTFVLSGATGKSLLTSIKHEIQARTSEWRSLPDLPRSGSQLEASLLTAIQSNGISADSLRKADKVSVRRAGFALKLRDVEAYARALPPKAWKAQRHAFLDAFTRHILVLPTFFDFFTYLSRVLNIATSCGDFEHLREMLSALERMLSELELCDRSIKAAPKKGRDSWTIHSRFEKQLKTRIAESIESSFPLKLSASGRALWLKHFKIPSDLYPINEVARIQKQHLRYVKRDLGQAPLKQFLMNPSLSGMTKRPVGLKQMNTETRALAKSVLPKRVIAGMDAFARIAKFPGERKFPSGLLFPTRPAGIQDLYLLHDEPFSKQGAQEIADCLLALRGFKPEGKLPSHIRDATDAPIQVPFGEGQPRKVRIAVASWKTELGSWVASITKKADPDRYRLDRLNDLLNAVLRCREKPDYLIFPELSMPAHWFLAIAGKLQGKGISLISGVQYLHSSQKRVHNQVWSALSHDALGFPSTMIHRQDKQTPAPHEEAELKRIGNKTMQPQLAPWACPPLINHGGFQFAMLICSELTNINYRAALRGKVDTLFVPQWNQDTESFNALVESAALDIHAYIVQCNDRSYGDSRIRVPHKDSWQRDFIRVKGGLEDYFVVGEIDVAALRKFQSSHRSPSKPFKPVPDGFNADMDESRKTLPTAE